MSVTVEQLAGKIGATVRGDGTIKIAGCAALDAAGPGEVSFLANPKYASQIGSSRAGAIILSADDVQAAGNRTILVVEDPYFAFREAMVTLHGWRKPPAFGISPQACIDPTAEVDRSCTIRPFVYIAPRARIGKRCVIYPHSYVGKGSVLGEDCVLYPHVTVYDDCIIANRVTLHAGCSIGQDGFGYSTHAVPGQEPVHHKIPQVGNVVIEDDVEMGANCSVDRATLGSTVIGAGTKFSNGVTIGHGCHVGPHNLIVAQVGLAGSVKTGKHVVLGGQVGIAGHLKVGDRAQVAATSGVMNDVPPDSVYGGTPAIPLRETKRVVLYAQRLPDLAARIKTLEREIERLKKQR